MVRTRWRRLCRSGGKGEMLPMDTCPYRDRIGKRLQLDNDFRDHKRYRNALGSLSRARQLAIGGSPGSSGGSSGAWRSSTVFMALRYGRGKAM